MRTFSGHSMSPPSREEIEAGEQAEGLFRDFCDKFRITYVYLDQSSFNKSGRLVRENAARPDFLVMEPHKMPFFVDVKAHKFSKPGGDAPAAWTERTRPCPSTNRL